MSKNIFLCMGFYACNVSLSLSAKFMIQKKCNLVFIYSFINKLLFLKRLN